MANDTIRYGISALDIKYQDYAESDELMVNGKNGQIHYKREDGQIVTHDCMNYTKEALVTAMQIATAKSGSEMVVSQNSSVTYYVSDITGMTDMLNDTSSILDVKTIFYVDKEDSQLLLRVRGNTKTNAVMSYLKKIYPQMGIKVTLSITEQPSITTSTVVVDMNFDELTVIKLSASDANTTSYNVKITSISFPTAKSVFNGLTKSEQANLKLLNFNNKKIEADRIDIVTYTKTESSIINDNSTEMQFIMDTVELERISSSIGSGQFSVMELGSDTLSDSTYELLTS